MTESGWPYFVLALVAQPLLPAAPTRARQGMTMNLASVAQALLPAASTLVSRPT